MLFDFSVSTDIHSFIFCFNFKWNIKRNKKDFALSVTVLRQDSTE